jgi:cell division protein FtsQ
MRDAPKTQTMSSFASRRLRAALAAAALIALVVLAGVWFRTSSFVRVTAVTITGIEGPQSAQIRRALTTAARDMTTLTVDDAALHKAVATYPVVRSLRTSTSFPHRLRIVVNAYDPVAAVRSGGGAATAVSSDGTLLPGTSTKGLPVVGVRSLTEHGRVGDPAARRTIGLLAEAPAPLRARVERVYVGLRGIAATVENGPKLYFGGSDRARAKWSAAAQVLASASAAGATYVDVRIPERPVAGGFAPRPPGVSASTLG